MRLMDLFRKPIIEPFCVGNACEVENPMVCPLRNDEMTPEENAEFKKVFSGMADVLSARAAAPAPTPHTYTPTMNTAEAEALLVRAAELGDPKAQYNLGLLYQEGKQLAPNPAQAYYWLSLAARHGLPEAKAHRDAVAKSLNSADREAQDARVAAFHVKKAGAADNTRSRP